VLARATALAATVCGVTAISPFSDTAPRVPAAALAVAGLTVSLVLRRLVHRVTVWHVHALLISMTTVISVCVAVATTPDGAAVTSFTYLWVAMYTAVFRARRAMLAHLALVAAGMAYGLSVSSPPSAGRTWVFLMGTIAGLAWLLNDKVTGLRNDATRDPLTGVLTRRAFFELARREMAWAARSRQDLTLVLVDLDDFKAINDRHGHGAGDAVLAGLPRAWAPHLRPRDAVGRVGGDEFAVLMPEADTADAGAIVQRMRQATLDVEFSAGAAQWGGQPLESWVSAADAILYGAKQARPHRADRS